MARSTGARLTTAVGTVAVFVGMCVVPFGSDGSRYLSDRSRLAEPYSGADFRAHLTFSYHAVGYLVFVGVCLAALFVVSMTSSRVAMVLAAVGVIVGGIWHQVGIGVVTNLAFGAYLPLIGAALVLVGLMVGLAEAVSDARLSRPHRSAT